MSATADALSSAPAVPVGKWGPTIACMMGLMGTILASTSITVALTDVMGAYGIGQDQAHWMATGFMSATTVCMLLNAWLTNKLGPRGVFLLAMFVFAAASVLAFEADNYATIVVARILQGGSAGIMQPLGMAVIFTVFPTRERPQAMGLFGMGVVLGPALGPSLGGFIVDGLDWRYVFVASLPMVFIAAVLGALFLPDKDFFPRKIRLNWVGLLLISVAVACFLIGMSSGQRFGWTSDYVAGLFAITIVTLAAFIALEFRTDNPLVHLGLFKHATFSMSAMITFMYGAVFFSSMYLMPLFMRTVQQFSATETGLVLLPAGLAAVVVFPLAGRVAQPAPPSLPIAIGLAGFALSCFIIAGMDANTAFWALAGWGALGRGSLGLTIPALNTVAMQSLPAHLLAFGAGTMNFIRMLGGALGIGLIAVFVELETAAHSVALTASQTAGRSTTRELLAEVAAIFGQAGLSAAEQMPMAVRFLGEMIAGQANTMAFQDAFMVIAYGSAATSLLALWLRRR